MFMKCLIIFILNIIKYSRILFKFVIINVILFQSEESLSSEGSATSHGSSASTDDSGSEVACNITLIERLIRSHPIWFLPGIQRAGAFHLLQGKEEGVSILHLKIILFLFFLLKTLFDWYYPSSKIYNNLPSAPLFQKKKITKLKNKII